MTSENTSHFLTVGVSTAEMTAGTVRMNPLTHFWWEVFPVGCVFVADRWWAKVKDRNWLWKPVCILDPAQSVQHQLGGPPASVSKTKQSCAVIGSAFVLVILHSFYKLWVEEKLTHKEGLHISTEWWSNSMCCDVNSHLQSCPSFHRSFRVGSGLKPGIHLNPPRKTCCALRDKPRRWSMKLWKSCFQSRFV